MKNIKLSLILRGILCTLVGVLCLAYPKATLESFAWIIGIILIVGAIVTFFLGRNKVVGQVNTMHLISSILMVVVGVLVIIRPQIIAILLGVFIFFEGIDFAVTALRYRRAGERHWLFLFVVSLLVVVFGIWAICTPLVGATLLSIVVGVGALCIAIDCFAALYGIGRVQRFFAAVKDGVSRQIDSKEPFEEAQVVDE